MLWSRLSEFQFKLLRTHTRWLLDSLPSTLRHFNLSLHIPTPSSGGIGQRPCRLGYTRVNKSKIYRSLPTKHTCWGKWMHTLLPPLSLPLVLSPFLPPPFIDRAETQFPTYFWSSPCLTEDNHYWNRENGLGGQQEVVLDKKKETGGWWKGLGRRKREIWL